MISLNNGISIVYKSSHVDFASEFLSFLSDEYNILYLYFNDHFPHKGKLSEQRVTLDQFEKILHNNMFRINMVVADVYQLRIKEKYIRVIYDSFSKLDMPCFILSDTSKANMFNAYIQNKNLNILGQYKSTMTYDLKTTGISLPHHNNIQSVRINRVYRLTDLQTEETTTLDNFITTYIRDKKLDSLL